LKKKKPKNLLRSTSLDKLSIDQSEYCTSGSGSYTCGC